jgi:hypothetical protein
LRDHSEIAELVRSLLVACDQRNLATFIELTQKLVPDWTPSELFMDFIDGPTERFAALASPRLTESS